MGEIKKKRLCLFSLIVKMVERYPGSAISFSMPIKVKILLHQVLETRGMVLLPSW